MTFSEEQVEWIVVEVLRRLEAAIAREASHGTASSDELRLTDRVITMRTVEGRIHNIVRLIVPKRAVVTPAVKDELKLRNVELVIGG